MRSLTRRSALGALAFVLAAGFTAQAHQAPQVVQRIYREIRGTAPTEEELARGIQAVQHDGAPLEVVFDVVDSPQFRDLVPDDDVFIVATYRELLDRDPTLHEWLIARHFVVDEGVRSLLIAGIMQAFDVEGEWSGRRVTEDRAEEFSHLTLSYDHGLLCAARAKAEAFRAIPHAELAAELERDAALNDGPTEIEEVMPPLPLSSDPPGEEYHVYYGYLHSHTNVSFDAWQQGSDGPKEAYRYARYEGGLDWFGVSDHAEYISTFAWNNEWKLLGARADEANDPGNFVALRGFEYSNPLYGHSVVFNTDTFISSFGATTQRAFYRWLKKHEGAVTTFNHPGSYDDLGIEFYHWAYYPKVDRNYIGQEKLQRGDDFTAYAIGYGGEIPYLDEALRAGWHLGAFSAQDNHSNGWGTVDNNRTGVLATELTREAIIEALQQRRFFATTDVNLELSFQINGYEMGAFIAPGDLDLRVACQDRDGEEFTRVQVYRGLELIHDEAVSGTQVVVEFQLQEQQEGAHYYAFVTEVDGGQAMSAPIWLVPTP